MLGRLSAATETTKVAVVVFAAALLAITSEERPFYEVVQCKERKKCKTPEGTSMGIICRSIVIPV